MHAGGRDLSRLGHASAAPMRLTDAWLSDLLKDMVHSVKYDSVYGPDLLYRADRRTADLGNADTTRDHRDRKSRQPSNLYPRAALGCQQNHLSPAKIFWLFTDASLNVG